MGIDNVVRKGHVDIIDTMTFLVIPDSTRNDSGKYCLTLQNTAGEKAVFVNVKVLGELHIPSYLQQLKPLTLLINKWQNLNYIYVRRRIMECNHLKNICPTDTPGPVVNIEVTDIQQTSAEMSWSPPEVDGGSEITHYIIEKREIDRKTWAIAKGEVAIDKIPFKVGGLMAGTEYYFRVTAVNQYGPGVPKVSPTSYLASEPISTYVLQLNTIICFLIFLTVIIITCFICDVS